MVFDTYVYYKQTQVLPILVELPRRSIDDFADVIDEAEFLVGDLLVPDERALNLNEDTFTRGDVAVW